MKHLGSYTWCFIKKIATQESNAILKPIRVRLGAVLK